MQPSPPVTCVEVPPRGGSAKTLPTNPGARLELELELSTACLRRYS